MKHFANVRMSKVYDALALEREHAQWVSVWCVLSLYQTYCVAEVVVERAMS